jgi:hypothetical protein
MRRNVLRPKEDADVRILKLQFDQDPHEPSREPSPTEVNSISPATARTLRTNSRSAARSFDTGMTTESLRAPFTSRDDTVLGSATIVNCRLLPDMNDRDSSRRRRFRFCATGSARPPPGNYCEPCRGRVCPQYFFTYGALLDAPSPGLTIRRSAREHKK